MSLFIIRELAIIAIALDEDEKKNEANESTFGKDAGVAWTKRRTLGYGEP